MGKKYNIKGVNDAIEYLKKDIDFTREHIILIGLDCKRNVLISKILFIGGINSSIIDLRIIFRELLLSSCHGFILGHNHPSNDLTASKEDLEVFGKLKEIANYFNFQYVDNIIFNEHDFISFLNEGILE